MLFPSVVAEALIQMDSYPHLGSKVGELGAREYVGERQRIPLLFPPRPTYRLLLVLKDLLDFLIATDLLHTLALNGALAKFFQKAIGPWKALQDGMGFWGCEEGWKTGTNRATLTSQELIEMSASISASSRSSSVVEALLLHCRARSSSPLPPKFPVAEEAGITYSLNL